MADPLVEEATRRSGVVWLQRSGRTSPVWQLWHDGAAHLVVDGGEQPLADVRGGDRVLVVVRSKERQADRVVQWPAEVTEVAPGSAAWQVLAPLLAARRLNALDGDAQPDRWARESRVLSLVPTGGTEPVSR